MVARKRGAHKLLCHYAHEMLHPEPHHGRDAQGEPVAAKKKHALPELKLIEEAKTRRAQIRWNAIARMFKVAAWASAFGVVGVWAFDAVAAFAGKETSFDAVARAFAGCQANSWGAWVVTALCGAGWFRSDRLRKRTIAGNAKHGPELERRINPGRQSSQLTETGAPTSEDLEDA